MQRRVKQFGIVFLIVATLCVGLAAQRQAEPHPIFKDLKVGQIIEAQWVQGGWEIYNYGGVKKIEEIGPDYLSFSDRGQRYTLYISLVKVVVIR